MKILAIVPARGGSKSISKKAIADLNGRPLIYYSLKELEKTNEVDKIIVSTDSNEIKNIVNNFHLERTEVMDRPSEFATDESTSESVLEYVLENIEEEYDYILFVQCTSPLTESKDFKRLIKECYGYDSSSFYITDYSFFFDIQDDYKRLQEPRKGRQIRNGRKREVGNAWLFKAYKFLNYKTRLFGNIGTCKIDYPKHFEIDEPEDLIIAEQLMKRRDKKC